MAVETSFDPFDFRHRHIGPSPNDIRSMLDVVGAPTLDVLIDEAIPDGIRQARPLDFGPALSEPQLLARMRDVASRNHSMTSLIGQGYYGSHLPAVTARRWRSRAPSNRQSSSGNLKAPQAAPG
jgi:glycine dehydrogenase